MTDSSAQAVRERIRALVARVPAGHSNWTQQRAIAFKNAVADAQRALSEKANTARLREIEARLNDFYLTDKTVQGDTQ